MGGMGPRISAPYQVRPTFVVAADIGIPFASDRDGDGERITHTFFRMIFPLIIFLDTFLDEDTKYGARSLAEDQFDIFNSIENTVTGLGFNGKSCLLRTVCEMQQRTIAKNSMLGQLFTTLMTPQKTSVDHLHDYIEAEEFGRTNRTSTSCSDMYPECPVSIFNMFRKPPDIQRQDNKV